MTSYTDTIPTGDAFADLFRPDAYDLWLKTEPGGSTSLIECAPNTDGAFCVTNISAMIKPVRVALHLRMIAIWEHPDVLEWSAVADLPAGTLLRLHRDAPPDAVWAAYPAVDAAGHYAGYYRGDAA